MPQIHTERRTSTKRAALGLAAACWALATASTAPQAAAPQGGGAPGSPVAGHAAVVKEYCATCHSERLRQAGLSLEGISLDTIASNADTWEKVVRKLQRGAMPPQGARRP